MLMLASVFFIACEDDDSKDPLTAEEAQEELQNLGTEMSTMMTNMQNAEGMQVIMKLNSMPYPFVNTSKSSESTQILKNIENYLLPTGVLNKSKVNNNTKEPDFDFEYWWGTYTWDIEHQVWSIVFDDPASTADDKIVINFPSSETATTNDATLTIHDYAETEIEEYDDYWEDYYYYNEPSTIVADLYLNDKKIVDVNMSATWIASGEKAGEPSDIDLDVYVVPFNFHVDMSQNSTTGDINAWIEYENKKVFSVGLDVAFVSGEDSPTTVSGYIQLFDVKFKATVALAELETIFDALDEGTSPYTTLDEINAAVNATIDAVVLVDGAKAADIIIDFTSTPSTFSFVIDETEGIYLDILFVYTDGTSQSAVPYFASFVASIEQFFGALNGFYGK